MNLKLTENLFNEINEISETYFINSPKDFSEVSPLKINLVNAITNKDNGIFWMVSQEDEENTIMISFGFTYPKFAIRSFLANLKLKIFAINNDFEYLQKSNSIIFYWYIPMENGKISKLDLEFFNKTCISFFDFIKKYNLIEIRKNHKIRRPTPICFKKKNIRRGY